MISVQIPTNTNTNLVENDFADPHNKDIAAFTQKTNGLHCTCVLVCDVLRSVLRSQMGSVSGVTLDSTVSSVKSSDSGLVMGSLGDGGDRNTGDARRAQAL